MLFESYDFIKINPRVFDVISFTIQQVRRINYFNCRKKMNDPTLERI